MKVTYPYCAGLDIQQKIVVVCCITSQTTEEKYSKTHTFSNNIQDILTLSDWLSSNSITHVALDNTGKFWKTAYNLLEANFSILAVNTQYLGDVPARKINMKNAEWIAELLRHGIAHSSFVQPLPQPVLRDLSHHRHNLVLERTRVVNSLYQVLESANVKLASVVSDVMQFSVRVILEEIATGQTNLSNVADLVKSSRQQESPTYFERVREHHRFLIANFLNQIDSLDNQISVYNAKIAESVQTQISPQEYSVTQQNQTATAAPSQVFKLVPNWEEVWESFLNERMI